MSFRISITKHFLHQPENAYECAASLATLYGFVSAKIIEKVNAEGKTMQAILEADSDALLDEIAAVLRNHEDFDEAPLFEQPEEPVTMADRETISGGDIDDEPAPPPTRCIGVTEEDLNLAREVWENEGRINPILLKHTLDWSVSKSVTACNLLKIKGIIPADARS